MPHHARPKRECLEIFWNSFLVEGSHASDLCLSHVHLRYRLDLRPVSRLSLLPIVLSTGLEVSRQVLEILISSSVVHLGAATVAALRHARAVLFSCLILRSQLT